VVIYQNDHLGTPQKLTAVNGAVVWSAKYSSFGEASVNVSSTLINNLRFPGQYFDLETGLYYNWHRYYDGNTGRYLTEDPTGFVGGINFFLYPSNPINYGDPFGLYSLSTEGLLKREAYKLKRAAEDSAYRIKKGFVDSKDAFLDWVRRMRDGARLRSELHQMELQRLGLDWRDGNMMDAIELLEKRQKYSHFINYSQDIENDCFSCSVNCLVEAAVGAPLGELYTKSSEIVLTTIAKKFAFKAGETIVRLAGGAATVYSGVRAVACIVRCAKKK